MVLERLANFDIFPRTVAAIIKPRQIFTTWTESPKQIFSDYCSNNNIPCALCCLLAYSITTPHQLSLWFRYSLLHTTSTSTTTTAAFHYVGFLIPFREKRVVFAYQSAEQLLVQCVYVDIYKTEQLQLVADNTDCCRSCFVFRL